MDLIRELGRRPIEVVSAVLLVVAGVVLTVTGTSPDGNNSAQMVLGGAATAVGGVLLSWQAGTFLAKREALAEVRTQLDLVSRNLGQAAGQIVRAVEQSQLRELHPATGLALVSQATNIVYAQVNAIQNIIGDPFDAADLLQTVEELDTLARQLERSGGDAGPVRQKLSQISTELRDRTVTTSVPSDVEVQCPYCGAENTVRIGSNGGDTATLGCSACSVRFNNHRRVDGSVFTREITHPGHRGRSAAAPPHRAVADPMETVGFTCPSCSSESRVDVPVGGNKDAVCGDCGACFVVNKDGASEVRRQLEALTCTPTGRYGSGGSGARPTVECPRCGRGLRCIVRTQSRFSAIHEPCGVLLQVGVADFLTWREANESETIAPAASTTSTGASASSSR